MQKIIFGLFFIVLFGWSDSKLEKNLDTGYMIWKFEKNIKLCKSSGAAKCFELGNKYANGKGGVKQDQFKAKIFYFNACKDSFRGVCHNLAIKYHKEKSTKNSYSNTEIYEKNKQLCKRTNGSVCHDLGLMYASGNRVKQDQIKSIMFYEKSCNSGNDKGCMSLAMRYSKSGNRKKIIEAQSIYKKACDEGNSRACILHKRIKKRYML